MKSIWKWILGIVLVLVVVAAAGLIGRSLYFTHAARMERFEFRAPMSDGFEKDNWRGPMFGYDRFHHPRGGFGQGMPMHGGRGYGGHGFMPGPFIFIGGLLRFLFTLAVLAAVGYFAYKKGKKDGMVTVSAPAPRPTEE